MTLDNLKTMLDADLKVPMQGLLTLLGCCCSTPCKLVIQYKCCDCWCAGEWYSTATPSPPAEYGWHEISRDSECILPADEDEGWHQVSITEAYYVKYYICDEGSIGIDCEGTHCPCGYLLDKTGDVYDYLPEDQLLVDDPIPWECGTVPPSPVSSGIYFQTWRYQHWWLGTLIEDYSHTFQSISDFTTYSCDETAVSFAGTVSVVKHDFLTGVTTNLANMSHGIMRFCATGLWEDYVLPPALGETAPLYDFSPVMLCGSYHTTNCITFGMPDFCSLQDDNFNTISCLRSGFSFAREEDTKWYNDTLTCSTTPYDIYHLSVTSSFTLDD